jgi:predicted nucleic-acid-binding protein
MIGLDTNVLVRFLVRDDEMQFARAPTLATAEGEGRAGADQSPRPSRNRMGGRYAISKSEIVGAFSGLLDAAELLFEDEASLEQALYTWKDSSAQFADCLIGARNWGLERRATASFDNKALRVPGFIEA